MSVARYVYTSLLHIIRQSRVYIDSECRRTDESEMVSVDGLLLVRGMDMP